MAKDKVA